MGDYEANPVRVSEYKSPKWLFKCTSWQYDTILDRCMLTRHQRDTSNYCGFGDACNMPHDVIVIQFRYQTDGSHVLPIIFWIKKDAVIGAHPKYCITQGLSSIFYEMNPGTSRLVSDMVQEVIDVARILASMPRNAGREGLSFVYEVNAFLISHKSVIDSLARAKFEGGGANSESQVCAVCLEDICKGEEVIWMPCSHIYHGKCILQWLERKRKCPTCLIALPLDE